MLTDAHREKIDQAADRMYDAIRAFQAAESCDDVVAAERELQLAADRYDDAISSGDLQEAELCVQ
jgi:hypothetical protein